MGKYRKKPVEIDAILFNGENQVEVIVGFMGRTMSGTVHGEDGSFIIIPTLEGNMRAKKGDYVIKEPFDKEGEFYPCKPDIFNQTYEKAE